MTARSASIGNRRRERWRNPRFLVPLILGVVVLSLLATWAYFAIAPLVQCAVVGTPSGSSGTECVSGSEYRFVSVSPPSAGHSVQVPYSGVTFVVLSQGVAGGPANSVVVNGTESGGTGATLYLFAGTAGGSGWQTQLSADGNFGVQSMGGDLSSVRLLVAVNPQNPNTQPTAPD